MAHSAQYMGKEQFSVNMLSIGANEVWFHASVTQIAAARNASVRRHDSTERIIYASRRKPENGPI